MPSLSMYRLSPPTDSAEFENMLVDYAKSTFHVQATLYGRKGQNQHGIDVIVETYPRICIQCKDYQLSTVTTVKIDTWINEAENGELKFGHFIIAVVGPSDARIQDYVYKLSDLRRNENKFTVSIVFWNDIEHTIKTDPNLLRIYYPEFYIANEKVLFAYQNKQQETMAIRTAINAKGSQNNQRTQSILISSEAELRRRCLELVVKYNIQELLRVDPFLGFPFDLASDADLFQIEMRIIQDKAISMTNWSGLFEEIGYFMDAVDRFNTLLSLNCQIDNSGEVVRIPPFQNNRDCLVVEVEERRQESQKLLNSISEWQ